MTDVESPRDHGMLDVGDGQHIWWEEWGAADGVPALYLHGGPGSDLRASSYRTRFDLARTRVVGFEQRGCGRSTPHASDPTTSLSANTTTHLVWDIEVLREHLGIDRWIVNGVSWGSTLALAYAQAHPQRVIGVVLIAVTTMSRRDVDWVTEGVGAMFPEAWDRFASHAEDAGIGYRRGRDRLVGAYSQLMESADTGVREAASQEWALWEDTHISIGGGGFHRDPRWEDAWFRHAFVLRQRVTKGPGSRAAGIAMAFKLNKSAQARWRAVNAPHLVALVRAGATFEKGKLVERPDDSDSERLVS